MPRTFEGHGIRFQYPDNWELEEMEMDPGWMVSVQSPDTAFMLLSMHPPELTVDEVLETTLAALREDYYDLEHKPIRQRICQRPAKGYNVHFVSLDFTNTCWIRSFRTRRATVLIMCQSNDLELEQSEPVLRAILTSLQLTDDSAST
ncbi:MAG: hypothetical protein RMJ19_14285 [Gemmatales bacterium]|nr:hypothetical protein [Gemmatales bacterium]MCS7161637.1 hypothetical protein [Gemmatales bacterium]MDW8176840.1 hypothetical protein [Gemmatales bacterium]MDW8222165.1 hypothetical protein [Gemmatales bacterium]